MNSQNRREPWVGHHGWSLYAGIGYTSEQIDEGTEDIGMALILSECKSDTQDFASNFYH